MPGRLTALFVLLLLTACASTPPQPVRQPTTPAIARCLDLYATLDQAVVEHGETPSSPVRIEGFPYLRVDRFFASYRDQPLTTAGEATWVAHLADLDLQARQVEIESLPALRRDELEARYAAPDSLNSALDNCSQELQAEDLAHPGRLELLREQAIAPPDYATYKRVLGIYPLTSLPVRRGVSRLHDETRHLFALPLDALPVEGKLQRFQPPEEAPGEPLPIVLDLDPLGIPLPKSNQLQALFAAHAPVWEIDVAGDFDRPGTPRWLEDGKPTVDTRQPVVYRYSSYTRWQDKVFLQLNYVVWFDERPVTNSFDILGGALDGIIWRVTLNHRGKPLLYDTIHPCGCYHLFFPTPTLRLRPEALALPEPPFSPQPAPTLATNERVVVRVSSGAHYILRVYADIPEGDVYAWRDYQELYAVPAEAGSRRSLFAANGLVPGTERGERWLLWPMGIASPGAMRERGRHATAFVGQRHFDDPYLFELLFEPGKTISPRYGFIYPRGNAVSEKTD